MAPTFEPVGGAAAWDAAALQARAAWRIALSGPALAALTALATVSDGGRGRLRGLPEAREALPALWDELAPAREELLHGSGVVLIRGLPIERLAPDAMERLYWLLGAPLGRGLAQNLKGELLGDVIDLSDRQKSARPFQNGGGLIMHRDPIDIVGLMCVRHAKAGGQSRIVSATRIHDELARERPDLLARLYEGFVYHRLEEDRGDACEFTPFKVPVFARDAAGALACFYIPGPIARAGQMLAPIDARGREALARFVELAGQPGFYYDMTLDRGDVQFLNNRKVLHGRTDYEDHAELERRRYMLRLWLEQPAWPALDSRQRFFDTQGHFDRAG